MKPVYAIITALAALAYAAPAPEADGAVGDHLEKRQTFGCGTCVNGEKLCWSCNSGGCSYTTVAC